MKILLPLLPFLFACLGGMFLSVYWGCQSSVVYFSLGALGTAGTFLVATQMFAKDEFEPTERDLR